MSDEAPPVPFALGMYAVSGSPPFSTLIFDDGAAVALEALAPLITRLNLSLPRASVFELVQHWDRTLPQLVDLVQTLAYADEARGHRAAFQSEEFLTAQRLLPEARQVYRVRETDTALIPTSAQGAAAGRIRLDDNLRKGRVGLCLAAVIGRMCHKADTETARASIAGWTMATEIVRPDRTGFVRNAAPGSVFLGPMMVPAIFGGDLTGVTYLLALMTNPVQQGDFADLARTAPDQIARLSHDALLLPGDVVILGDDPVGDAPDAEHIDVVEAMAKGLGRQIISLQ